MKTKYTIRLLTGLIFRATGLVAIMIGGLVLVRGGLSELWGGSRSFSFAPYAVMIGIPCTVFGIICRFIAARLLRGVNLDDVT